MTLTKAIHPDGQALSGAVKDKDLMTLKEFMDWAPKQPWYVPPQPNRPLREMLDNIARTLRPTG